MSDRYPGYNVLAKRNTPSWNDQTRRVIDARMAIDPNRHDFFTDDEWATLQAVCARIVPQPKSRSHPAPVAAMVDLKLKAEHRDGYRDARLPPQGEAWRRGLKGFDAEAQGRHATPFHELDGARQDQILKGAQKGDAHAEAWGGMSSKLFFEKRLLHDRRQRVLRPSRRLERDRFRRPCEPPRVCPDELQPPRPMGGCRGLSGARARRGA